MMYEDLVQKLENDVRIHIRHQNFLKLHIESLQHTIEIQAKEIQQLRETCEKTLKSKDHLEKAYTKEKAELKLQGQTYEKTVNELKERINELNMFITTNNANSLITMDKRDTMFMTQANSTVSNILSKKSVSYK